MLDFPDHRLVKLGRRPPHAGMIVPKLADFRRRALPPPPPTCKRSGIISEWGMHLNDAIGDCTIAAAANAIQTWTAANGALWRVADAIVEARYGQSGYRPGKPATDQGAVETDVLGAWSRHGWDIGRQDEDVTLWAALQPGNDADVREAIYHFGGLYVGLLLPDSAQNQPVWDVGSEPGTWGGHAVWVTDYDADGLACITWNTVQRMTWAFWKRYCEEAYALFNRDWLNTSAVSPTHLDFYGLRSALDAIAA
jgi:hypothetical protein